MTDSIIHNIEDLMYCISDLEMKLRKNDGNLVTKTNIALLKTSTFRLYEEVPQFPAPIEQKYHMVHF